MTVGETKGAAASVASSCGLLLAMSVEDESTVRGRRGAMCAGEPGSLRVTASRPVAAWNVARGRRHDEAAAS